MSEFWLEDSPHHLPDSCRTHVGTSMWKVILPKAGPDSFKVKLFNPDEYLGEVGQLDVGDFSVVVFDRKGPSFIKRLLRLASSSRGTSVGAVKSRLVAEGYVIHERYNIWASAAAQRIVVPVGAFHAFEWVHRAGILGGGGRSVLVRLLVRVPLVTRLLWWLAPARAFVVTQVKGDGLKD